MPREQWILGWRTRLAAAGCAILGLAGCGGQTVNTVGWFQACNLTHPGAPTVGLLFDNYDSDAEAFTGFGYDGLASDMRNVHSAVIAGDQQGAETAMTKFYTDVQGTNLATCGK